MGDAVKPTGQWSIIPEPVSRTELVTEAMKEAILRGDLAPGQPLVERELAQLFNVSKTPIREALRTLARTGLVETTPYRGMTVVTADATMARHLYEVRAMLEPEAVASGVDLHDDESLAGLDKTLAMADDALERGDQAQLIQMNREFHRQLYSSCDNTRLIAILNDLQDQVALVAVQGWGQVPSWEIERREHRALLSAVCARDASQAREILRSHINEAKRRLERAL